MIGAGSGSGSARVVVGVDGSPGGRAALAWAMADAARRDAGLLVVSAFPIEIYWGDPNLIDDRRITAAGADTETRVTALVDAVAAETGGERVPVDILVLPGPAAHHVLAAAEGAGLLVVGSRGRGPVKSTLLGSVALHAVTHARCPVVVVHPRAAASATPPRVVVGLDGSDASRVALEQALAEAGRLGAEVTAVAAYSPASYWSDAYDILMPPLERLREEAQRRAEAMVSDVLADGSPAVPVTTTAVQGPAGEVLVSAAEGADLLVVGGRGHSAIPGMLLGSVALHCVVHAPCPVMVVPVGRGGAAVA